LHFIQYYQSLHLAVARGRDDKEEGHPVKAVLIMTLILVIFFCGCKTCRVTSVEDANAYASKGYQTRIAVYKTGLDGLLWGAFLWTHHAQAQVLIDGKWKWVGILGLSDSPTFSIADDEIYYRGVGEYTAFLKTNNLYY